MSVKEKISKSGEGYPLLGHCIYWSVYKFQIPHNKLVKILSKIGIDLDYAKEPRAKAALTRAMREVSKTKDGSFHRKVVDDQQKTIIALVDSRVSDEDIKFKTETKANLTKGSNKLEVEGSRKQEIEDNFNHFKGLYTSDQFTGLVKRYLFGECEAITVRDSGGVYFVPSHKASEFKKLEELFEQFSEVSLDVIPVIDTKQAKKSMWKALVGRVEQDLENMKEDLARLPEDPRAGVIEARVERYQALKEKVENYEDLLSGTASKMKEQLESIGKELKKRLV